MTRKGFTLVEIMIVVTIIAVLAAIGIPNLLRARVNANEGNAQLILKTIANACESYAAANEGSYPAAMQDLTQGSPPYLNEDYTATTQAGYNFACDTLDTSGYACSATPAACNTSGTKTFTITSGGIFTSADCT